LGNINLLEKKFTGADILGVIIGTIIVIPLVFLFFIMSSLYYGWAFAYIWNNIVVNAFGVWNISIGQAMLLFLLIGMLKYKYEPTLKTEKSETIKALLSVLLQPLIFILMARLIEYFFI